jgi:hypothetical protein
MAEPTPSPLLPDIGEPRVEAQDPHTGKPRAVHARGIPCGAGARWGSATLHSNAALYSTCRHRACKRARDQAEREARA